ncbi:MAG: helix-turn-helix domain-containing protein [Marinifilaceae bacterium]
MYYNIGHSLATQFIQNAYYGKDIALPSHSALKWLYTIGFKYFNYIISLQILCFLFDSYIALKTYRSTLNNYYSDADCAKYKKHYITVIGIICWGITCLAYSIVSSFFPRSEYAFVNYLFIVHFIIIFVVGHSASRITHTMADIIARNDHIEQMMDVSKVSITDDEIYAKLIFHIEESKAYLVPQLSIYDLCTELNVNRIRLSYVIFEHFGLSFSAYINKLRVEYATEYLRQNPDIHIDSLYTLCGFTSIASFYRSFKSFKHCSPKQWAISGNDSISIA